MCIDYKILKRYGILADTNSSISYRDRLNITDWVVLRHLEELSTNTSTSLTEEEYIELTTSRRNWRERSGNEVICLDYLASIGYRV